MTNCPGCGGLGTIWDDTACGDPDHCSPNYECQVCNGTGRIKEHVKHRLPWTTDPEEPS